MEDDRKGIIHSRKNVTIKKNKPVEVDPDIVQMEFMWQKMADVLSYEGKIKKVNR